MFLWERKGKKEKKKVCGLSHNLCQEHLNMLAVPYLEQSKAAAVASERVDEDVHFLALQR